jgi:hypothetical protein
VKVVYATSAVILESFFMFAVILQLRGGTFESHQTCVDCSVNQGGSGWALARMSAIESRLDDIEGKVIHVLASTAADTEALEELKSMLRKYMAKMQEKEDVSPSASKATVEDHAHISFSAAHPIRASGSEREPINTPDNIHHGSGAKADVTTNPYSLGDGKADIPAEAETERGGDQATEKNTSGLETRGIPGSGLPLVAASLVLHASAQENSASTLPMQGTRTPPSAKQSVQGNCRGGIDTPAVPKKGLDRRTPIPGIVVVKSNPPSPEAPLKGEGDENESRAEEANKEAEHSP